MNYIGGEKLKFAEAVVLLLLLLRSKFSAYSLHLTKVFKLEFN